MAALFILIKPIHAQQAPLQLTMPQVYICAGNNTVLDAGIGTCAASYLWGANGATTQTISVNQPGSYVVTITYADGGICEKTFSVTNYPANLGNINVSGTLCAGNTINLTASAGCNYVWSSSEYSISNPNGSSITVTPQSAGVYNFNVTGTNYYGCQETKTTSVTINPSPNVTITANRPTFICAGTDITLTGNGASSYSWSNGASTNSITIAPTSNTTYTVTGTNSNGCSNIASLTVTTSTACVSILSNRCGNTIDNLFDDNGTMMSTILPNVSDYIFTFTPVNNLTSSITLHGNLNNWVSLWQSGTLIYDTQYFVTVQALFNDGTYSPVSPVCTYTIEKPATSIQSAPANYCGRSVSNLQGEKMFAFAVGNALNYQFTFTGISGIGAGTVCTGSSGNSSSITLTSPNLNQPLLYGTTYSVTVQVTAPGPNGLPVTGPVSAPCVYTVNAPQTTVRSGFCGTRNLGNSFAVTPVLYATSYVYTFSPVAGGTATEITSTSSTITLSSTVSTNTTSPTYLSSGPQLSNNTVYNVSIIVTAQGITGPASTSPCQLTIGTPTNRVANPRTGYTNESINEAGLTIFPNPAKEKINITLGNVTDKKYTIEMYDMFGKLIYKNEVINEKASKLNTEISLTNLNLSKGIYLIYVNSDSQKTSQRVVIE